jgi:hypothetical protein
MYFSQYIKNDFELNEEMTRWNRFLCHTCGLIDAFSMFSAWSFHIAHFSSAIFAVHIVHPKHSYHGIEAPKVVFAVFGKVFINFAELFGLCQAAA